MSYCVNCGVELDKSATKCALCNTPVHNPNEAIDTTAPTPFSNTPIKIDAVKRKFVAIVVTYIMLIPNIVCALLGLFFTEDKLWFIHVLSASALAWVVFVFPFITKKPRPYLMWAFNTVATALYVLVFHAMGMGGEKWYIGIALPTIAIVSACALYFLYWARQRKRHWTSFVLHIFVDLVICLTVTGTCLMLNQHIVSGEIVFICDISCLALVFFWMYANKSKKVRAWLAKKMFI